jgi:LPS-assembly protein
LSDEILLPRLSSTLSGLVLWLTISTAVAEQALVCEVPTDRRLSERFVLPESDSANENVIEFEAGEIEANLGNNPGASMSGGIVVRRGQQVAGAEAATYVPETGSLMLTGGVRFEGPNTEVQSQTAEFSYGTGRIRFDDADFLLGGSNSRGSAHVLEINQQGILQLNNVTYTTCPPGSDDWLIEAGDIKLDTAAGTGRAKNVRFRFQGVPVLYTPYFSFPLGDARKSGILAPVVGSAGRSGNELSVPYYWNIRENYDATITPRLLTSRGAQIESEFRYLTQNNAGTAAVEYLANDRVTGSSRHLLSLEHQTLFENDWRNVIDITQVSDAQYFEDLGGSLSLSSMTHLNQRAFLDYYSEHWSAFAQLQKYQTIDESILPVDRPYRRMPQARVRGLWPDQFLGLRAGLGSELVYFDRDVGVTGWRLNVAPEIAWPVERAGWFVTPSVTLDHTRYQLDNTASGEDSEPARTLPIASIDVGVILERAMKSSSDRVMTLEPRLLYAHIPYREQSGLPVFDTLLPDLNLVQLYRKNRFLGIDRIGDTDQLSIGITSRIHDVNNGRELVTATIGQARYLSEQGVTLPGEAPITSDSSDYIAEVRFLLYQHLNFDFGQQWGAEDSGTTRSEARIQYRPASNKIVNLAYRFRRDSLEQGDVSWTWPLSQQWNFVGRYNYSLRDQELLEQLVGLEYESCCWGLRLVSRRYLSTRDGTRDSSIGLQLVLKGMTSIGTAADTMLEHGILGYSSGMN